MLCVLYVLSRWWPGQVVPMDDVPDNIMKKQPGGGMFVVRYIHNAPYTTCIGHQ